MWSPWLNSIAPSFDISAANLAIFLSLVFSMFFLFLGLLITNGRAPTISGGFPFIAGLVIFTFMEWLPIWTGAALALFASGIIGYAISIGMGTE